VFAEILVPGGNCHPWPLAGRSNICRKTNSGLALPSSPSRLQRYGPIDRNLSFCCLTSNQIPTCLLIIVRLPSRLDGLLSLVPQGLPRSRDHITIADGHGLALRSNQSPGGVHPSQPTTPRHREGQKDASLRSARPGPDERYEKLRVWLFGWRKAIGSHPRSFAESMLFKRIHRRAIEACLKGWSGRRGERTH
jgi:hypothetical protein